MKMHSSIQRGFSCAVAVVASAVCMLPATLQAGDILPLWKSGELWELGRSEVEDRVMLDTSFTEKTQAVWTGNNRLDFGMLDLAEFAVYWKNEPAKPAAPAEGEEAKPAAPADPWRMECIESVIFTTKLEGIGQDAAPKLRKDANNKLQKEYKDFIAKTIKRISQETGVKMKQARDYVVAPKNKSIKEREKENKVTHYVWRTEKSVIELVGTVGKGKYDEDVLTNDQQATAASEGMKKLPVDVRIYISPNAQAEKKDADS